MEIIILSLLVASFVQIIISVIWFGPLFGKTYAKLMKAHNSSNNVSWNDFKSAKAAFIIQAIVTLIFTHAIYVIGMLNDAPFTVSMIVTLSLVAGVIWPFQISAVIWGQTPKEKWLTHCLLLMSNSLISALSAVVIISLIA